MIGRKRIESDRADKAQPGLLESSQRFLREITEYFTVRLELIGLESGSAFKKVAKAAAVLAVSVLFLGAGFLYLSLSLVYVLAVVVGWGWGWALLTSGISLVILTVIGLLIIRSLVRGSWFPTTISELKKDTAWLKKSQQTV